jgi:hypothetical protein
MNTWKLARRATLAVSLALLVSDPALGINVYSQNFNTATAGVPFDTTTNNGGGGGNSPYTIIGSAGAPNSYKAVIDTANIFGLGTSNQYLELIDVTSNPNGLAPAVLSSGTKGFQVDFDFFDPAPTFTGSTRVSLGSGGSALSSPSIAFFIGDGVATAFTDAVGESKSAAFTPDVKHHVRLVGNYDTAPINYDGNTQSVNISKYDVWIDGVLAIDEAPFRASGVTSSDTIRIGAGSNSSTASTNFDNFLVQDIIPPAVLPQLVVDRQTGAVTLQNPANAAALDINGYSISSAFGGLNATNWKAISGNYDGAGNGSVDDGLWAVQSSDYALVSELTGDAGATLAPGQAVVISQGSGLWIPTHVEDLAAQVSLVGGGALTVPIVYTGNNGTPLLRGDFNGDGQISAADYTIAIQANFLNTALTDPSPALRYRKGDLDGDSDVDIFDYAIFRADYDAAHGTGAFQAMVASVPEPSTALLLGLGGLGLISIRRRKAFRMHKCVVFSALAVTLLVTQQANAVTLGYWRLGDDDPASANGSPLSESIIHAGSYGSMLPTPAVPQYSNIVPGRTIRDPLADQKVVNSWSMGTLATVNQERTVSDTEIVPTSFTVEGFVRFPDVAAANGDDFLLQRTSANGGWSLELGAGGIVHANLSSRLGEIDSGAGLAVLDLNSTAALTNGQWHHVALVFQGNSQDASNDAHLFVDYTLQASGNVEDTTFFGGHGFPLVAGEVSGTSAVNIDEIRFVDTPLALNGSQFLRVAGLRTTINTVTGELKLINDSLQSVNMSSYQITSTLSRLLTDNAHWSSLHDQNRDPVSGGNDPGETWDESPNASSSTIGETFLLGGTVLAPGTSLSLGTAYDLGTGDPVIDTGLAMQVYDLNTHTIMSTLVEYKAGGLSGDFNSDGKVDAADYVVWRKTLGDLSNYNLWRANFGATSGSGSGLGSLAAVPEPTVLILVVAMTMTSIASRRVRID